MTGTGPTVDLERDFAEMARTIVGAGTLRGMLDQIVSLAVTAIDGCDAAGLFLADGERVTTVAASDPVVIELDHIQIETGEGPCLDAMENERAVYADDLAVGGRWPSFGRAAGEKGIRSTLAIRLSDRHRSALNCYARLPAAFGATDRAKGVIFATLAGIALDSAEQRAKDEKRLENLHQALSTRELIGQAQGILMERERITGDQAFAVLRRASQHLNVKIREVARTLVETGETPPSRP